MKKKKSFKVGDLVFFEYRLFVVDSMDNGKITRVRHSMGLTVVRQDVKCFHQNEEITMLSEIFSDSEDELLEYSRALEFKNIRPFIVNIWIKACENKEIREEAVEELKVFVAQIKKAVDTEVFGIQIFKKQ